MMWKYVTKMKKNEPAPAPESESESEAEAESEPEMPEYVPDIHTESHSEGGGDEMATDDQGSDGSQDVEINDGSDNEKKPKKKKKVKKGKRFRYEWTTQFKWLAESSKGCYYFKCKPCGKHRKGGLTEIKRHEAHNVHQKNASGYHYENVSGKGFTLFAQAKRERSIIKRNEVRITMFLLEQSSDSLCRSFGGIT